MSNTPKTKSEWFSGRVDSVLFYKVALLHSRFSRLVAQEAIRGGLTHLQFKALSIIGSFGPLPATRISESLTMDQAAVSRIVRQLLDLDLITRRLSDTDARVAEIALSKQGVKTYEKIATRLDKSQAKLLESFDTQERAALFENFDRLLEAPLVAQPDDTDARPKAQPARQSRAASRRGMSDEA
ncbi:MAG TPA: MarR family transcriptional regulator [Pararobbsia sp.]|jgi:DNA-binding MarR family transcriptional regulator|nr:MarR family transcriptional regulator [Pararobbsia sp.]